MSRLLVVGGALAFFVGLLALALPTPAAQASGPSLDRSERTVIGLINRVRVRAGVRRLRVDGRLARAAHDHTTEMIESNYFGHSSTSGASFGKRLNRYTTAARVGENIGYVAGAAPAPKIVRMWMNSAGHRTMILEASFRSVGVGGRGGLLGSRRVTVFTADFASL
jgi:uncharacterized protein YkwD